MVIGFTILIWLSVRADSDAPPIPEKVEDSAGQTLFTGKDVLAGQQVFLKYGLMENGSIWGHGAYLGPDFSAEYLHALSIEASQTIGSRDYGKNVRELTTTEQNAVKVQFQLDQDEPAMVGKGITTGLRNWISWCRKRPRGPVRGSSTSSINPNWTILVRGLVGFDIGPAVP